MTESRESTPALSKRRWTSPLLDNDSDDQRVKRRRIDARAGKRRLYGDRQFSERESEPGNDSEPETSLEGTGTQYDPIRWRQWEPGNLISKQDDHATSLDENDDEQSIIDLTEDSAQPSSQSTTTPTPIRTPSLSSHSASPRPLPLSRLSTPCTTHCSEHEPRHLPIAGEAQDVLGCHSKPLVLGDESDDDERDDKDDDDKDDDERDSEDDSDFTKMTASYMKNELKVQTQWEHTKFKKRLFWDFYAEKMKPKLRERRNTLMRNVRNQGLRDCCWLYEGYLSPTHSRNIKMTVSFRHEGEEHRISINFGFIHMFLEDELSDEVIESIIEEWWSVSHLCGNWRCTNFRHLRAEPGPVNTQRNVCLRPKGDFRPVCIHDPPCLTHLTVPLDDMKPDRYAAHESFG